MANTFRVFLDACVMLPQNLNNLLLTLADDDLFTPVWSPDLLDEVQRNLVEQFGLTASQAEYRIAQMRHAFPQAENLSAGYRGLLALRVLTPKFVDAVEEFI